MNQILTPRANQRLIRLPEPSKAHATCAWCRQAFPTIVELIDHVDPGHLGGHRAAA